MYVYICICICIYIYIYIYIYPPGPRRALLPAKSVHSLQRAKLQCDNSSELLPRLVNATLVNSPCEYWFPWLQGVTFQNFATLGASRVRSWARHRAMPCARVTQWESAPLHQTPTGVCEINTSYTRSLSDSPCPPSCQMSWTCAGWVQSASEIDTHFCRPLSQTLVTPFKWSSIETLERQARSRCAFDYLTDTGVNHRGDSSVWPDLSQRSIPPSPLKS